MYRVNTHTISEESVYQEMQYHAASDTNAAQQKAAEALIIAELLRQRATQLGLEIDSSEAYVDTLLEREVPFPEATQQDCETYYAQNREKFATSPLLEARHILLACAPDDAGGRSQANDLARELIAQLQQCTANFEALARQHSHCPSKETGGNLGQISSGQTVPEFEKQLFRCDAGLVESPMESRYGVHVVFIQRREPAKPLPYEMVAERIAEYLNARVRNIAITQYIATLIENASIEGYEFKRMPEQYHH